MRNARPLSLCAKCAATFRNRTIPRPGLQNSPRNLQIRYYHHSLPSLSSTRETTTSPEEQAFPLSGYYADLLTPSPSQTTLTNSASRKAESSPTTQSERAKILFGTGSRVYNKQSPSTPQSSWRTINGVPIPPRPAEPDNCCMSGCVHCVWDDYRDEVEDWAGRVKEAQAMAHGRARDHTGRGRTVEPKQRVGARREVQDASMSMDDDGGGSETNWGVTGGATAEEEEDAVIEGLAQGKDLFESIPVGIREFIKTEKRLRDLHKQNAEQDKA